MIQRIKKLLTSVVVLGLVLTPVLAPAAVYAQDTANINDGLCAGSNLDINNTTCSATEANTTVNSLLKTIINIFSLVVGVVSVIMIIVGGLKYITSGGDSGNVTGAKNTILYAVIGLVVVALAQFIVRFVLGKAGVT